MRRRRSGARWIAPTTTLAGVLALAWSFTSFLAQIEPDTTPEPARHAEGAVALTGGPDRIAEAVELLARGDADRLLITGVNPSTSRANLAQQTPRARALYGCCIELGYEAANTVGNATETERWARAHHIRNLIVVTSNYHMPRALAEIGSLLPDVDLIAYPVVSDHDRRWWADASRARMIVTEYLKYMAAQVRLRLAPPRPDMAEAAAAG